MNRKRLDFTEQMPNFQKNITPYVKKKFGGEDFILLNKATIKNHIANTTVLRLYKKQFKLDSKVIYKKINQNKLPVLNYTKEYFYLLQNYLEENEKIKGINLLKIKAKNSKVLEQMVNQFCDEVLIPEIGNIRDFEFGEFHIDRFCNDFFKDSTVRILSEDTIRDRNHQQISKLIFESIAESTNDFKDINKKDLMLFMNVLRYAIDKDKFAEGISFLFTQEIVRNSSYYSIQYKKHKLLIRDIVMNLNVKNLKSNKRIIKGPKKSENNKGKGLKR